MGREMVTPSECSECMKACCDEWGKVYMLGSGEGSPGFIGVSIGFYLNLGMEGWI